MTLGMLDAAQAAALAEAGLDYYNHNLDTSPEYYEKVITTRTFADRLDTLSNVRDAGINVDGFLNVTENARKYGCGRFIFVSSGGVAGSGGVSMGHASSASTTSASSAATGRHWHEHRGAGVQ